jgi:diguanylate cyclase (GGDEF)-like protein
VRDRKPAISVKAGTGANVSISDQDGKRIAWRRRYLYLALLLLAILPAGLYLYSIRRNLDRRREEQALQEETQLARLSAALLQEHLQQGIAFMQAYASRDEFRQSWEAHDFGEVTSYLKEAHGLQRDFISFQAFDLDGTLRAIYPPDKDLMKRNFASQEWYQGLSRNWNPYVSELFQVPQKPYPVVVAVAVPLRDTKGRPIAILMAPYALGNIEDWLSGIKQQGSSTISLVDQKGHLTVFPAIKRTYSTADGSGFEPVRRLLDGKAGADVFWRGKEKLLVAYEPIPAGGWGIVAEVPATAALNTTRMAEARLLVFGLMFVALTMSCGVLLAFLFRQLKYTEEKLGESKQLALSDPLTDLWNYRWLVEVLGAEIERSHRTRRSFALILFDLDGLKTINDTHGHLVGSRALCRVANALRRSSRAVDTAARYGGDEFALVLPESEAEGAQDVAKRVAEQVRNDGEEPRISVSFGVAALSNPDHTPEDLFRNADEALYAMKAALSPPRRQDFAV